VTLKLENLLAIIEESIYDALRNEAHLIVLIWDEEFRVSLFAQHKKTPYPVSAKRLDKAWDKRN